ncbi:MAG: protein translocase subunit SecF [Candidatus Dependentiae bacterium]|nr:protein translocase subunit SecF [Candidatus Dependentiae bacterium]
MVSFVRYRGITAIFSLSIMAAFVGMCMYRIHTRGSAFTYSVDFEGGTQVLFGFNKHLGEATLKDALQQAGFESVVARDFGKDEILVRVKDFSGDSRGVAEKMVQSIEKTIPGYEVTILQSEAVGPGVGEQLRWKSVYAVLMALLILLIYIALRFLSFGYALGAVIALFHDAIVMLAVFLFLDREISINVIGAILAVLGYSINDTIIIFSQIRKNCKEMMGSSIEQVVDVSINQTLRRTMLTSFTTGLAVGSMYVLGGEALRDFSLALLVGIVFGTYSSIYIASPVMMLFNRKTLAD